MKELKPCPFCDGDAEMVKTQSYGANSRCVICWECDARAAICSSDYAGAAEEKAVKLWNNRTCQTIDQSRKWISINDRLPEVDKYGDVDVLVHMDDGFIATCTYDKNNGWELWADAGEVTHWMLLPEPPKEVSNDD